MKKWSPWPPSSAMRRYEVKVGVLRLEGIGGGGAEKGKVVMVEMRWKEPKLGLVPLRRKERKSTSMERAVGEESWVDFGDSFENVCGFSISSKGNVLSAWDVSFSVLYVSFSSPPSLFSFSFGDLRITGSCFPAKVSGDGNLEFRVIKIRDFSTNCFFFFFGILEF